MANTAVISTRARFGDLAREGAIVRFREVFNQANETYDGMEELNKIFNVVGNAPAEIRDTGVAGLPLLVETAEGDAYKKDALLKTYDTDYSAQKLTMGTVVTEEAIDDSEYSDKIDQFKHLAIAGKLTKVKYAMNILNAGFSSGATVNGFTVFRYGDTKNLFSVSHTRKDGGTAQSNASATGVTLTETNLETGRLAVEKQLTDRGLPMSFGGRLALATPSDLTKTGTILVDSDQRPSTANNDINFYKGVIMDVITSKWLNATGSNGSTTAWFLVDQQFNQLKLHVTQDLQPYNERENNTRNHIFGVSTRLSAGHSDWRGTWGSKGDGVAYAS